MKFNLKNRPKPVLTPSGKVWSYPKFSDFNKWFEGFEKELREMKTIMDDKTFLLIKEILGENKK